ncbi:hypothetical protein BH20ACT5_BH20ACT5_05080 [soil metagenome]
MSVTDRLPASVAALAAGQIDVPKLRKIAHATCVLDQELAGKVAARVLPRAGKVRLPALGEALDRAVISVDDPDVFGWPERGRPAGWPDDGWPPPGQAPPEDDYPDPHHPDPADQDLPPLPPLPDWDRHTWPDD